MAGEEGITVPGESDGSSLNPDQQVEQAARNKGWKPQEEFQGAVEDWVPAREFVGRQKLYDTIHDLKRQLNRQSAKFDKDFKVVAEHLTQVRKEAYKKAMADLEQRHAEAIRNEDPETATQVVREMTEKAAAEAAQDAAAKAAPQNQNPATTEEFLEWKKENSWFDTNTEMQEDAVSIGIGYAAKNPNATQAQVLEHVTSKIKKIYSDQFETQTKKKDVIVESASGSLKGGQPKGKKKITTADLEPEQLVVMRTLIKRGAFAEAAKKNKRSQEEEYLAQYQESLS